MSITLKKGYTRKDLEEIDKKYKMVDLCKDSVINSLISNNKELALYCLNDVIPLNLDCKNSKIILKPTELDIDHDYEYFKKVDFNFVINNHIFVNWEFNRSSFKTVKRRNWVYMCKIVGNSTKAGKK